MVKTCTKCLNAKNIDEFYKDSRRSDGHTSQCKTCKRAYDKARWHNPHVVALRRSQFRRWLLKQYGLTQVRYDAILSIQDGKCAICRTENPGGQGTWKIDHDHDTKEVRGLLCYQCNLGLGHFDDLISLLIAATRYMYKPPARSV